MIVDGKKIAEQVYEDLKQDIRTLGRLPVLAIITCAANFETKKYLRIKEDKAKMVSIATEVIELDSHSTTEDFIRTITAYVSKTDGIIVQLPLPPTVDVAQVLHTIPVTHDVDALNPETTDILSPVVRSIARILGEHAFMVPEKLVTIIGSGRLVGLPAYHWFVGQGAHVSVVTRDTADITYYTKQADIIVTGAGKVNLITPDMIKEGVVLIDAGTSEDGGELRGDADPSCADKAFLFTPVPGGVGPVTIAMLLSNVVLCAKHKVAVV